MTRTAGVNSTLIDLDLVAGQYAPQTELLQFKRLFLIQERSSENNLEILTSHCSIEQVDYVVEGIKFNASMTTLSPR